LRQQRQRQRQRQRQYKTKQNKKRLIRQHKTQEEKDKEAKEKEEPEKKRFEEMDDWPLYNIENPGNNDFMCARGAGATRHEGNKRYRRMVKDREVEYVNSTNCNGKGLIALEIIREWRAQRPPGRFLKQNDKTGNWYDVGDKKAKEKTSQALREKAPQIKKEQEVGHPRSVVGADTSPSQGAQLQHDHVGGAGPGSGPFPGTNGHKIPVPCPHTMVKRDTSNQNENYETKPKIKRPSLNRDQSATSNRLKQEYMPDIFNRYRYSMSMRSLQDSIDQIFLTPDDGPDNSDSRQLPLERPSLPRPAPFGPGGDRVSTLEALIADLFHNTPKPSAFSGEGRVSTIEALGFALDNDGSNLLNNNNNNNNDDDGDQKAPPSSTSLLLPKAQMMTAANRLSTSDFWDIFSNNYDEDPFLFDLNDGSDLPNNNNNITDDDDQKRATIINIIVVQ